ncbi:hypothetical protein [Chthonobacter rhizosphaerae]|uniref:hypothetical protein n=1 Tax=Chthonobacter rhizosphaerae TaxID=2735553 RepID=UPI0015EE488A|nr:hypothetical protein [Chthonobacter rhizosphaerae]
MMTIGVLSRGAALAAVVSVLAGCSTVGDMSPGAVMSGGRDLAKEQESAELFRPVEVCPQVQVRDGTQVMPVYERGKQDDPSALRFQATVSKFSRDCRTSEVGTAVRVGVAGRLLAGPSGATGQVNLPVRVVLVRNGDEVLYSELHVIPAEIAPGTAATNWSKIVENVVVPPDAGQSRYVIYVGFDETGAKS